MVRISGVLAVALLAGCLGAEEVDEVGSSAMEDSRLRVAGPGVALTPNVAVTGQELRHGVVSVGVALDWRGARLDVKVPRDFWVEARGYYVDLAAGTDVHVRITGPRVQVLVRHFDELSSTITTGNDVSFRAERAGRYLVMVLPNEIQAGADHITYDLVALTTAPAVTAEPATWSCDPAFQGSSDGCDCGCGAPDPDCDGLGCVEPGCADSSCAYCYDAQGASAGCAMPPP